ncbi:MAG TPA: DUF2723 domain-containing protein [Kofleriaceae bacterium]|nr:DUF2723 domain-containing protein [Kofleriaceae bacterium]
MGRLTPRVLLIDRGGLIALAALVAYVWIAPPHIVDGDNAEFATLGTVGGVAHPTGYPAYLLWLRAMSWLPGAEPAHTTAIATAILAAIQLVVLHAACRAWGARSTAATFTVAIYAAGPVVMRYSTEAEVFAMNQLVVAAVLYLAAQAGPLRGGWRVAALGLVAGIGISDHLTCVLAAPVGLLGAVRGVREARRPRAAAAGGVAALIVGLTPYAYLFVTREPSTSWGLIHNARELLDHLLRVAYGGPGAFSPHAGRLHVAANLLAFVVEVGRAWCWLPGLAGLALLGYRCVRAREGEPRIGWQMLALAFVVSGPALATRFDLPPTGLYLYVIRRFHLLPTLLLAPAVAAGFELAIARVGERLRPSVAGGIAVLGFATAALIAVPDIQRVRTPAVENAMRGMLHGLPPNAVVLATGDIPHFGFGYLQDACGERRDVLHVYWHSVGLHWYRARLAQRGLVIDTSIKGKPSVQVAEQILASGRPLLVDTALGNVLNDFPSYPYGTLFRVLPRGQPRPSLDEVAAINRTWFAALDLDYPLPSPDDEYPTMMHEDYADVWRIIANGYTSLGRRDAAADAWVRVEAIRPHE